MAKLTLSEILDIPMDQVVSAIVNFIKEHFTRSRAGKAVIGLSGGLDSSVTARLLVEAVGTDRVVGVVMPDTRVTPSIDVEDAVGLSRSLGIEYLVIPIDTIIDSYSIIPGFDVNEKLPVGNLRARVRMSILYYIANKLNGMVIGTGDRSEILLGYFTKYGDGGVDILPLACLYKTQVRELGRYLGIPARILSKPSSPRLWRDHLAEEELGLRYEVIDLVFYSLIDKGLTIDEAVDATGIPREVFVKVIELHRRNRHKRRLPPVPSLPWLVEPIREI